MKLVFAGAFTLLSCAANAQAWKPAKPVEIIVGVTPGGGIDRTARILQKIMQDRRLIDSPVTVVNKPGGGMTLGMIYINQHAGDAHYLFISAASTLTNQIMGKSTLGYKDFTPLAMLYDEYIGFAVKSDSPMKSAKDLLDALKTKPESVPVAIATSLGNTNHIAVAGAVKLAGGDAKRLRVVTFGSGGESMTAVMGGHAGLVITPAANLVRHVQSGRLTVLAIAAPQRVQGPLANTPTLRELGNNTVVSNWRPMLGPKNLNAAQIAYWDQTLAAATASEEWRKEVERNYWAVNYLSSRDVRKYWDQQYRELEEVLTELGLAKKAG